MINKSKIIFIAAFSLLMSACAKLPPYDYTALLANTPRSILVLPPLNESVDVDAPAIYMSTITRPLAERGYYIFPVGVITDLMVDNGLTSAAEMHQVPLNKIKEIIAPDAVLYVSIKNWGTKYTVFASTTVVDISAKLIDTNSGVLLWDGASSVSYDPNASNQNGLIGALLGALVNQMLSEKIDYSPQVSTAANNQLLYTEGQGLLQGPYKLVDISN